MQANPPRVLMVANGAPPHRLGGAEIVTWRVAAELVAAGYPAAVLAVDDAPEAQLGVLERRERDGVVLYSLGTSRGLDAHPRAHETMSRVLGLWRPDAVWVHHPSGLGLEAIEVAASHGQPLGVTFHDYWWFCPRGQLINAVERPCTGPAADRCPGCLAPGTPLPLRAASRALTAPWWADRQARARSLLTGAALRTAPSRHVAGRYRDWLGVDVEWLPNPAATVRRLPAQAASGPIRVGYFGTLLPSKGVEVLARAARRVGPGRVALEFHGPLPAGRGWRRWRDRLRRLAAAADVRWAGPYGAGELDRRMGGVEIVAVPSLWEENAPLVIDEALAAGRPVLASAVGGLGERLDDPDLDLLLPAGDVDAWAGALADTAGLRRRSAAALARPTARPEQTPDAVQFLRRLVGR
jgi:glycosyltransferase involved in cell wall biosynthesis